MATAETGDPDVATRPGGHTYHLTPEEVWTAQAGTASYQPEAFAADGFIHCTDGEVNLLRVANTFYQGDRRPHVVLALDRARITAPVLYEDPDRIFPHVYGPLNTDAVVAVRPVIRLADGSFAEIGPPIAAEGAGGGEATT
jgi:uncharacterized protein (DUF952 family)